MILKILIWIHMNIVSFSFLYWFLKTKYWNKIEKKNISHRRGGGMFDNGNVNWCMLGRAFLCRTGHFCVEPGFFVSNHPFCCQTGLFFSQTSVIIVHTMQARVVDSHVFLPVQNTIDNTEDCHSLTEISPQSPLILGDAKTRAHTHTPTNTHMYVYIIHQVGITKSVAIQPQSMLCPIEWMNVNNLMQWFSL